MLSMKDRWLLAMMNGPVTGTFSRPLTCGRKSEQEQRSQDEPGDEVDHAALPLLGLVGARPRKSARGSGHCPERPGGAALRPATAAVTSAAARAGRRRG